MRRSVLVVAGCALFGGGAVALASSAANDPPDLAACELHVRTNMPANVEYQRVNVTRVDTAPLTSEEFKRQAGPAASVHGLGEPEDLQNQVDEYWAKSGNLALRTMVLTYRLGDEVQPRKQVCAFRLVKGALQATPTLMSHATTTTQKALDTLADIQKRRRPSRPKYSCCL